MLAFACLILFTVIGASAESLQWIHLGVSKGGSVKLLINGEVVQKTSESKPILKKLEIAPGSQALRIETSENEGSPFELTVSSGVDTTLVSCIDPAGNILCRTILSEGQDGKIYVLNLIPKTIMSSLATEKKAIYGKGFWIKKSENRTSVICRNQDRSEVRLNLVFFGSETSEPTLVILSEDQAEVPNLTLFNPNRSFFESTNKSLSISNVLQADLSVITRNREFNENAFDPATTDWAEVSSYIFWLNLMIGRDPCRLEINEFSAIRRLPSGRSSGFVKWPPGKWTIDVVVELSDKTIITAPVNLNTKASTGIISLGGADHPHRVLILEGRSRQKSEAPSENRIRFVNALPVGSLVFQTTNSGELKTTALDPGEVGDALSLGPEGFGGAALRVKYDHKEPPIENLPTSIRMGSISPIPKIPVGDWIVVVHLNRELSQIPAITWIEMDRGTITNPVSARSDD